MRSSLRLRLLACLIALAASGVLGGCNLGPDGSCRPPTPCGSDQGHNP